MRNPGTIRNLVLLACCALLLGSPRAFAQEGAKPSGVKSEMLMWIEDAEKKLVELAEATPEAKYGWRPGKGVRSTAEVFLHVSAANFGIPGFLGLKPPEGFDIATYEKSLTKKADITTALKDSFAHMKQWLANASDEDLEKPVDVMGMKMTARGAYLLLLSHAHEHLGQSIAYARSNAIVPPWTARREAQQQKARAEEK